MRDDAVKVVRIFELHQNMGHFVRVIKALLGISQAEKNKSIVCALPGREQAGDLAGLITQTRQVNLITKLPTEVSGSFPPDE